MSEPILYLDRSVIRSPDVVGLREAVANLTEFVRKREPQLLFYGFEIDERMATMRVVAVHPDSEQLKCLADFPRYFAAIRYWQDEDSGHWEEVRKVLASSIGSVVAGLREFQRLMEKNQ